MAAAGLNPVWRADFFASRRRSDSNSPPPRNLSLPIAASPVQSADFKEFR
jgi:hypothetical protein